MLYIKIRRFFCLYRKLKRALFGNTGFTELKIPNKLVMRIVEYQLEKGSNKNSPGHRL